MSEPSEGLPQTPPKLDSTVEERVAQLQAQRDELADILKELVGAIEASVHLTHRAPLIARARAALQAVGK